MNHKRIRKIIAGLVLAGLGMGWGRESSLAVVAALSPGREAPASLGGVKSSRTEVIDSLAAHWPPAGLSREIAPDDQPVRLRAWSTPGDDYYMGLEQAMVVDAGMDRVEAVLDDFGHYQDLFPDYKDIHVVSRKANRFRVYWEQKVPLFFIPNVKYEMFYELDKSLPDRRVYRYQLARPGQLRHSDGLIVLERRGTASTFYFEIDFFDADWGPAKVFGKDRLWKETVDGLVFSDVAVKLKAEHPDWSYARIHVESAQAIDRGKVRARIEERIRERAPYPAARS